MTRYRTGGLLEAEFDKAIGLSTNDPYRDYRNYLYKILRRPGEENAFRTAGKPDSRLHQLPLMPLLAGDGPNNNELPSKFLRLTDYQLYILRQWAEGKFFNEVDEGWVPDKDIDPFLPYKNWKNCTGRDLGRSRLLQLRQHCGQREFHGQRHSGFRTALSGQRRPGSEPGEQLRCRPAAGRSYEILGASVAGRFQ